MITTVEKCDVTVQILDRFHVKLAVESIVVDDDFSSEKSSENEAGSTDETSDSSENLTARDRRIAEHDQKKPDPRGTRYRFYVPAYADVGNHRMLWSALAVLRPDDSLPNHPRFGYACRALGLNPNSTTAGELVAAIDRINRPVETTKKKRSRKRISEQETR